MQINIDTWTERLKKPAGLEAQLLMAPELRREELKKLKFSEKQFQSAVLVLLFNDNGELKLLLTLRSPQLRKHGGQVSFPGGKQDKGDKDLMETAFREAHEEVGLVKNGINVLGWLSPLQIPISGFTVNPLVSYAQYRPNLNFNSDEVERIIEVRIADLLQPSNIKKKNFGRPFGKTISAPYFDLEGVEIWGATAMMIAELLVVLFPESGFMNDL